MVSKNRNRDHAITLLKKGLRGLREESFGKPDDEIVDDVDGDVSDVEIYEQENGSTKENNDRTTKLLLAAVANSLIYIGDELHDLTEHLYSVDNRR